MAPRVNQYLRLMSTPEPTTSKPEWFQLTEADQSHGRPSVLRRVNRAARLLALATPLLVVGMGFLVAQSGPTPATTVVQRASITSQPNSQPTAAALSLTTGVKPAISIPTSASGDGDGAGVPND